MAHLNITGFGAELAELKFDGVLDWFVSYVDPVDLWRAHKSILFCEAVFILGGVLMFLHALRQGGRWPYLYFASIFHGFTVELLSYFFPHIDNFWHAQGVITIFERRMALYIVFVYPVLYYHASWAMSKMKLSSALVEHMAVGLLTVLIDMPYDIIGIKYLHWVWHDTDPNIADRHYWVPWNSYYFHLCFSASFQFFYHSTRKWIDKRELGKWERGTIKSEIASVVVAAFMGMPGGCLLFIPLYHPLHDFLGVHSEVTSCTIIIVFLAIVWKYDRKASRYEAPKKLDWMSKLLIGHLVAHYAVQLGTAIFINPKEMIAIGVHEVIGDCNETVPIETILMTLSRRKYLCVDDYDEKYFDFHCLPDGKPPKEGSFWYTICGTDFENRAEFITVIAVICLIAFIVFRTLHFDYDEVLVNSLSPVERKRLTAAGARKTKTKQKTN